MIESEIDILQMCDHPNIISYKGHSETEEEIFIILELFEAIPLNTYVEQKCGSTPRRESSKIMNWNRQVKSKHTIKLKEEEWKIIFKQILAAIEYLHKKCISHRDIKLSNLLIDESKFTRFTAIDNMTVKLVDFGFSIQMLSLESKTKQFWGTPSFISPELANKKIHSPFKADVWALGVVLYKLLTNKYPFYGK